MNRKLTIVCSIALLAACRKTNVPEPTKTSAPPTPSISSPAPAPKVEPPVSKQVDRLAAAHGDAEGVDHLVRSRELNEVGDRPGALLEAQRALFDDPRDEDALGAIAKLSERMGKKEMAVEALARLAEIDRDDPSPLVRQARLLISLGRFDEALIAGRGAVARDAEDADAHQVTGRALLGQGELSASIQSFERVVELAPDHGYAWNNLGLAHLLANENDEALDALTHAAQLLPEVAYVQNNFGIALERAGHLDEAMRAYATAVELSPKYVKAKVNLERLQQLASTGEMPDNQELDEPSIEMKETGTPE